MKNIILAVVVAVVGAGSFAGGYFAGQKAERSQYVRISDFPADDLCFQHSSYLDAHGGNLMVTVYPERAWYNRAEINEFCSKDKTARNR